MQQGQISALQFYSLSKAEESILVNSLIHGVAASLEGVKASEFVVVNKTKARVPFSSARQQRDNVFLRYGKMYKYGDIPILDRDGFRELGSEIKKIWDPAVFGEKHFLFFGDTLPESNGMRYFDSFIIVVKPVSSAIPFAYQYIKAMTETEAMRSLKIIVYGERDIEKSAEFFLGLKNELAKLARRDINVTFAGSICIPAEEKDLLILYDTDIIEAFPNSALHGQIQYALQRILLNEESVEPVSPNKYFELSK